MATATKRAKERADGKFPQVETNGGIIRVEVTAQGVSPLLMNKMTKEELLKLWTKEKKARNAERPRPRDHAEARLHTLGDGTPCIPPKNLMSCLIAAGQYVRLDGKRQVSTQKSTVLPGLLTLESTEIPLETPEPWEVDLQQGRNPNGGEAVCIIRPRFDAWRFSASIVVDTTEIALNTVRNLWDIAGQRIGLGDFRPQRKGTFGRFVVVRWEVV